MVQKKDEIAEVIIFVPAAILGSIPRRRRIGRRIVPKANPTNPPKIPIRKDEILLIIITYIDKSVLNNSSKVYSIVLYVLIHTFKNMIN